MSFPLLAAAAPAAGSGGSLITTLAPLLLIFLVFYFLLIRPQQKRMKEHAAMVGGVKRGDVVVTGGGLIGKITKVADQEVTVEFAEGVRIRVTRGSIAEVRAKTEPAKAGAANDGDDADVEDEAKA